MIKHEENVEHLLGKAMILSDCTKLPSPKTVPATVMVGDHPKSVDKMLANNPNNFVKKLAVSLDLSDYEQLRI